MRILLTLLLLLPALPAHAVILNNAGTAAQDSLAITFQCLDSLGRPVALAAGDSIYLLVFGPSGALCHRDSMAHSNARITAADWEDFDRGEAYTFRDAVANLDGAGTNGIYRYVLTVQDNTGADLETAWHGAFTLYTTADFTDYLDDQYFNSNWSDSQRDSVLRSLRWSEGNSLARLGDVGLGAGTKSLVVYLIDTSGVDDTIPDVLVSLKDAGQSANLAQGRALPPGRIVFAVNAATAYVAVPALVGYVWPITSLTTTAGASPDTLLILGYNLDPGTPATASLCRVYGWVQDLSSGQIAGAEVRARIAETPLRYQGIIISPYERRTTTDSLGYWYLDLYPSELLTPDATRYEFEIRYTNGAILRRKITVPNTTTWLLTW
ncbi:MAG TPA: hypothetical protein VNN55_00830 [bacterium]|nr:hypothetical protein [bacterium]